MNGLAAMSETARGAKLPVLAHVVAGYSARARVKFVPRVVVVRRDSAEAGAWSRARRVGDARDAYVFGDCMEAAMTGLLALGVLLFGAALLKFGMPAGSWRNWTMGAFYAGAGVAGVGTVAFVARGLFAGLVRARKG